ncbi:KH domain-containing protein [Candidatus Saccharibacteria bacterium]|nr:KH domain-containing protein [Candidatus Saccharibacteria bacterium]
MDQQFIEYIVKSLVGNPDAVSIERRIDEKGVLLELTVDPEDLGRVIGKRGATAQSLRTLLRALGTKNDARYNLKIVDVGGPRPSHHNSDDDQGDRSLRDQPTDDSNADEPVTEEVEITEVEETLADSAVADARAEEIVDKHDTPSDVVSRTRRELADLDDLDV